MRRTSMLAMGTALAVAFVGSAVAYKPLVIKEGFFSPVELNGGFEPTRLPKSKRAPVHLSVGGTITPPSPQLEKLVLEIDRNVAFDARGLALCRARPIDLPTESGDPCKEARVGKGEMEFEVAFPETTPFSLKSHVVAYNGGKRGGTRTILVLGRLPTPVSATVVVRVVVTKIDDGRYGSELVAAIPSIAGGNAALKRFQLEFFRQFAYKGKKQSFAKARCFDGKLQVGWKATLADGSDFVGNFKRACTSQP